jgi:biopolymer transport protein ExbD
LSKKMKKFGKQPVGRPASDINVTPLVDVVLVLLIIFMVVTPLLEKDIEVRVPDKEENVPDTEVPQDQLVVSIDKSGNVFLNSQPIAWNDYADKMKKVIAAKAHDDRIVFFTPDDQAGYNFVVKALDGAKEAGAVALGVVTDATPVAAPGATPGGAPPAPPAPPAPTP